MGLSPVLTCVASGSAVARLALARVWGDAGAVKARLAANRHAVFPLHRVPFAALLDWPYFGDRLICVHRHELDFVFGTSRRDVEAPGEHLLLNRFGFRDSDCRVIPAKRRASLGLLTEKKSGKHGLADLCQGDFCSCKRNFNLKEHDRRENCGIANSELGAI